MVTRSRPIARSDGILVVSGAVRWLFWVVDGGLTGRGLLSRRLAVAEAHEPAPVARNRRSGVWLWRGSIRSWPAGAAPCRVMRGCTAGRDPGQPQRPPRRPTAQSLTEDVCQGGRRASREPCVMRPIIDGAADRNLDGRSAGLQAAVAHSFLQTTSPLCRSVFRQLGDPRQAASGGTATIRYRSMPSPVVPSSVTHGAEFSALWAIALDIGSQGPVDWNYAPYSRLRR